MAIMPFSFTRRIFMGTRPRRRRPIVLLVTLLLLLLQQKTFAQDATRRPNFIFLYTDDLGFGDLKSYGHPYAITDHLDRLAREGTLFKNFHNTGNICPNSRTGFMTSRHPSWFPNYPAHFGFRGAVTVTQLLKEAGYVTGHLGKWNIGPTPNRDDREHLEYGVTHLQITGDGSINPQGKEAERMGLAMAFIEQYQNKSFYLQVWMYTPHAPITPPTQFTAPFAGLQVNRSLFGEHMQERFDQHLRIGGDINVSMQQFHGEVHQMDFHVGRLLLRLDELGLSDHTVVVFSSDNGPAWPNPDVGEVHAVGWPGGLRGGKHVWYEGGPSVPFLVRWPAQVPAGKVNEQSFFSALDWLPTVCTLAGAEVPWDLVEGEDVSDIWMGSNRSRTNPTFYQDPGSDRIAVRFGKWKMLRWTEELFDLEADRNEFQNVYDDHPEIVAAMTDLMNQHRATNPPSYAFGNQDPLPFDPTEPVHTFTIPQVLLESTGMTTQTPTVPPSVVSTTLPPTDAPPSPAPTVLPTDAPSPVRTVPPTDVPTPGMTVQPMDTPSPAPSPASSASPGPTPQAPTASTPEPTVLSSSVSNGSPGPTTPDPVTALPTPSRGTGSPILSKTVFVLPGLALLANGFIL